MKVCENIKSRLSHKRLEFVFELTYNREKSGRYK